MTRHKPIDNIDRKILECIQEDGRIAIVDLAERVNLSKTPCLQRLRRLERDRYILGYRAELDPHKIAHGYLVYVQVKLDRTKRQNLEEFNRAVRKIPQILTCDMMSGGYDYLLKIRSHDMAEYRELLGDVISGLPGLHQTSTYPVIEEVKDTTTLPIGIVR